MNKFVSFGLLLMCSTLLLPGCVGRTDQQTIPPQKKATPIKVTKVSPNAKQTWIHVEGMAERLKLF